MSNPFDIVNNILQGKEEIQDLIDYVPFITNKSISYHYDCVMQANEINLRAQIQPEMQYQYLFHSIRKYKRPFKKWQKKEKPDDSINAVKEYYGVSTIRAREMLTLINEANLLYIKEKIQKGGITK